MYFRDESDIYFKFSSALEHPASCRVCHICTVVKCYKANDVIQIAPLINNQLSRVALKTTLFLPAGYTVQLVDWQCLQEVRRSASFIYVL